MNSSFFRNIEWDAIYERRQDGPYVPELPSFMTNRRRNTDFGVSERDLSAAPIPENWKKVDFSPVPIERMTFVDPEKERVEAEAKKEKASKKRDESGDEDESDDNSMEESDESDEGEIAMRDSVFVTTDVNNQLADWSFIDEAVLMSYVTAAAEGKTGGKKKKSKKKDVIVEEEKESKMETIVEEVAEEATSEKEQPTPTPAAAPEQEETTPTNA